MKTAVEQFMDKILEQKLITGANNAYLLGNSFQECLDIERAQKCEFANQYADNVMAGMTKRAEDFLQEYELKTE
jgi:hypothetical protein